MSADARRGTLGTEVPARLDRLPSSRVHRLAPIGLATAWSRDRLEVASAGSSAAGRTEATTRLVRPRCGFAG